MGAGASVPAGYASLACKPFATFELARAERICAGTPADRRVVLLGECTHGTEEFYRTRAAITKELVEKRGFTACCFEADWPFMAAANEYVHRRRARPFPEGEPRFPSWMWRNRCFGELLECPSARGPAASRPSPAEPATPLGRPRGLRGAPAASLRRGPHEPHPGHGGRAPARRRGLDADAAGGAVRGPELPRG